MNQIMKRSTPAHSKLTSGRLASSELAASATLSRLDLLGAFTALLCAVHCALLPLAVSLLPLVGLNFLTGEGVEWMLLLSSAILAGTSLRSGYLRHRSRRPLALLSGALALMILGHYGHAGHTAVWPIPAEVLLAGSGLLLAAAHVVNAWLDRRVLTRALAVASTLPS